MEDELEDVDLCNDRLWEEKVVFGECDARREVGGKFCLKDGTYLGEILDGDLEVWECFCKNESVVAT